MESLRGYWRRKKYVRLGGGTRRKSRVEIANLGVAGRRRRFWRIKISPRLSLFPVKSPKRLLVWLRDAYMRMMMRLANSAVFRGGFTYGIDTPGSLGFGKPVLKEYDEKVIIELYKSIVAQQLLARRVGKLPEIPEIPEIACTT